MFYFSRKKGNKLGVVDTSDGIEEFYTSENIKAILRSSNITIIKHSDMKKIIDFVYRYLLDLDDIGSDGFYDVIAWVKSGKKNLSFGGSRYDYATTLISYYEDIKKIDPSFPFEVDAVDDLLLSELIRLRNIKYKLIQEVGYTNASELVKKDILDLQSKWHLKDIDFEAYTI